MFGGLLRRVAAVGPRYLQGRSPLPRIRLDAPGTVSGTTKFWEATAGPDGLRLRWGLDGQKGQNLRISLEQCADGNPVRELVDRSEKKLAEGYRFVEAYCR